jgi:hypothetical protein
MRKNETRNFCCNSGPVRNSCIDSRVRIGAAALNPLGSGKGKSLIWFFSAVKPDDLSVREGKISRRTGFFFVHDFRSASLAGLAQNTTDCRTLARRMRDSEFP